MGSNIMTTIADLSICEYHHWFLYFNVSQWICCNLKLGTVYRTGDANKEYTGSYITIILARLWTIEYINSYVLQWIWNNWKVGKVYSTEDEIWRQEILIIICYNKTIMSMSDDFGT